jgi:hypothetical protein
MLRFPILALALIFSALSAYAEMLPAYDSEAICSDVAGTSAKQELIMRGCLDFQERTRKEIALAWDKLPGAGVLHQGSRGERRLLAAQELHRQGSEVHDGRHGSLALREAPAADLASRQIPARRAFVHRHRAKRPPHSYSVTACVSHHLEIIAQSKKSNDDGGRYWNGEDRCGGE